MTNEPAMKECCICDREKPIAEFNRAYSRKDRHQPYCRACYKKRYGNPCSLLDQEWLQTVGFDSKLWLLLEDDEITTTLILIQFRDVGFKAMLTQCGVDDDETETESSVTLPGILRTRADLRDLLRGLKAESR